MRKPVCFVLGLLLFGDLPAAESPDGLRLELNAGGQSTVKVTPNVHLFLRENASASPLIPGGRTTAEWTGYVNADLRGDFRFKAMARGTLTMELNGKQVLSGEGDGVKALGPSDEIRLNKGPNKLRVIYQSPLKGDGFVRLLWSEYGFLWEPIHPGQLTRDADDETLKLANRQRHGRDLLIEGRCVRCHMVDGKDGIPELSMDAPGFEGIGSRRHAPWMAKWILDPKGQRPGTKMPVVLHGKTAEKDAEAIAAFLGSLKGEDGGVTGKEGDDGQSLVEMFHCAGCHNLPGTDADPIKLSLDQVNEKFPPGHLAAFLMNPTKHYQWRRMPNFDVSQEEALAIATYLRSNSRMVKARQPDATLIPRGRKLVQTAGCLNCHQLDLPNEHQAKALAQVANSTGGCLSKKPSGTPHYAFDNSEITAVALFLKTGRKSLHRHVTVEFAERHVRNLRCTACHGELEGFPPLERLGGKLKPEFMHQIIAGKINYKPRPWLEQVMPAFPAYAEALAEGLAHSHGYPDKTKPEGPINQEAAKIGRQMMGVNGGFSCVSCHGIGDLQPTQVFEAEGINLSLPARRLQKDYFVRWILNPLKIEPQTKMPVYFDEEGNSMLYDVLEGKTMKQVEAMWQYMRKGDEIDPPKLEGF